MAAQLDPVAAKRQQIMYEAIPVYCTLWDENFNKIDCNDTAHLFYGLSSKEEYLGWHTELSPEFQPDGKRSLEKAEEMLKIAFEKGQHVFEWLHQTIDGELLPSEVTFVRVNIDENTRGVVGYTRDLREVKAAEAKAKNEEYQKLVMLDSMPLGCNLWDENFQIIDCNYEASKMLGFTDKAEYLKRYSELSPEFQPDGEPSKQKADRLAKETLIEGACDYDWMHQTLDGELVPTTKNLFAIDLGNGKMGIVGYTHDLREKKAAEAKINEANERFRIMFDNIPLGCLYFTKDMYAIDCNDETLNIFGVSDKQEFIGRFHDIFPEFQPNGKPSMALAQEYVDYVIANGRMVFEWLHQTMSGDPIPMEITLVRVRDAAGINLVAYMHDLREKKAAKAQIDEANERLRVMFDNLPLGCVYLTKNLDAIDCNDETLYIFGIPNKQDFLNRFRELFPALQPDGRPSLSLAQEYVDYVIANGRMVFEWLHQTMSGDPIPMEITLVRVIGMADIHLVVYMHDLRELKDKTAMLDEAHKMAFSDPLTGISNRRSFLQKSKQEFRAQQGLSPIGIIMLDIDHFKRINDTYGHDAGDEALKVVSENIGSALRETDLFARYGGEEFIVMVQHLELPELTKLAERVCEKIRQIQFSYAGQKIPITISAGVAMRKEIGQTIEEVIKRADVALYMAKANGRDRVETLEVTPLKI